MEHKVCANCEKKISRTNFLSKWYHDSTESKYCKPWLVNTPTNIAKPKV